MLPEYEQRVKEDKARHIINEMIKAGAGESAKKCAAVFVNTLMLHLPSHNHAPEGTPLTSKYSQWWEDVKKMIQDS